MIIVKLTILSVVITAVFILAIRLWVIKDFKKALSTKFTGKYPKWLYGFPIFVFLDIIGILASVVYLLFFR